MQLFHKLRDKAQRGKCKNIRTIAGKCALAPDDGKIVSEAKHPRRRNRQLRNSSLHSR
jgi:hypothetical protein